MHCPFGKEKVDLGGDFILFFFPPKNGLTHSPQNV
jgi:hypothetical protein